MAIDVIEKKKRGLSCAECGASVSAGATECPECGSKSIKKSLVIVRKSVADTEEELDAVDVDEVDEDEDLEDEDDEDEDEVVEVVDEDEEDDEDDEDEEDEEDDEEDEDEVPAVSKSLLGLEALNISTAFAEDIVKVFNGKKVSRSKYESVMTELNNVMDAAADRWFAGQTVSKSKKKAPHIATIQGRVNGIIKNKEGKEKMPRPKGFDKLDDETKAYIESLEPEGVEKRTKISKRADLPKDVRKSLEAADKIVEERETEKWLEVAKGYEHIPGNEVEELAKSLRTLSEADPDAYVVLKKSLDAAEENLKTSEIFKTFGAPGGGDKSGNSKRETEIKKAMDADSSLTREQAEVAIMDGSAYQPTNA